jgi:GNAT superfamily N-acetyltransferase
MSQSELEREFGHITFYGWEAVHGELVGIMGFEPVKGATLIRHTYVLPKWQGRGIASKLLTHLKEMVTTPRLLVGTWADAKWAISFYEKRGFKLLPNRNELLETYWNIPRRQIETSVVLCVEMG